MSSETPHAEHFAPVLDVHSATAPAPDFDRREIVEFGKDDGNAVTVIGKMLVGFFFYSLIVMIAVGYWTWRVNHAPAAPAAAHEEE